MKFSKNILLIIVLLALVLRLPNINTNFSGDEIDIAGPARHFITDGDFRQFNDCNGNPYYNYTHPPVRLIIYSMWSSVAGFSNVALRLLPMLFGIGSILLIYLLGKEIYSRNVGIIAALLAALSRYHIYASTTLNTDTGHFSFFVILCVLSFIIYKKRNSHTFLALFVVSFVITFLTKFSAILIIMPLLFYSFRQNKNFNKDLVVFVCSVIAAFALLYVISLGLGNSTVFSQPIASFTSYASATSPSIGELVYNKVFYAVSVSWQLTPFLAILLLLSIFKLKRDKEFYFLLLWLLLMTAAFFYTYQQDVQRFFVIALPPVFLLVAKYLEKIPRGKNAFKMIVFSAVAVFIIALAMGLSDLTGFYQPVLIGLFYLIAVAFSIPRYRNYLLIGGFTALSIYSVMPNVTIWSINSTTIDGLSKGASAYPYADVWSSKDVLFYTTPNNETVKNCNVYSAPDKAFLESNAIEYFAFYNVYRSDEIKNLAALCSEYKLVEVSGYTTGIVCKVA